MSSRPTRFNDSRVGLSLPASLWLAVPPYTGFSLLRHFPEKLEDGTVLLIGPPGTSHDWPAKVQAMVSTIRFVRLGYAGAAIGSITGDIPMGLLQAARKIFILSGSHLEFDQLPESATDLRRVACGRLWTSDVELWLQYRFSPKGVVELGVMKTLALTISGAAPDRRSRQEAERLVANLGLPTLHRWEMAGLLVRGLLQLQRAPSVPIRVAAKAHDYGSASSFARACSREFGEPPGKLRTRVGWAWLFERFLRRRRRSG